MNYLRPLFTLSYSTTPPSQPDSFPNSNYYGVGPLDICFVLTFLCFLGILRELVRLGVMTPFARWYLQTGRVKPAGTSNGHNGHNGHINGHANGKPAQLQASLEKQRFKERNVIRFAEQGWSFIYYVVYWSLGLYIHISLPTSPFRPENVWIGYPHNPIAGEIKFYYLSQIAFWLHQVLILNAEAHRKDHWQMMTHHIVTIILVVGSYLSHFTRVGCLILVMMDLCDIFLPLAKMFRYLALFTACDITFVVFLLSWIVTRQGLFLCVIISTYYDGPRIIPQWPLIFGYDYSWHAFIALLSTLQILLCIWTWSICRVAYKVIRGNPAEDTRSDSDHDNESETDLKKND